jgi:hypothetical protein
VGFLAIMTWKFGKSPAAARLTTVVLLRKGPVPEKGTKNNNNKG